MTHLELSNFFEYYQTERIRSGLIEKSCAPDNIPSHFGRAIEDIFKIIEKNFHELSNRKPYILIFGLQPSCTIIKIGDQNCFCCSLLYLPAAVTKLNNNTDWSDHKTLVIDFTRGLVMCPERYVSEVFNLSDVKGKIYGEISNEYSTKRSVY